MTTSSPFLLEAPVIHTENREAIEALLLQAKTLARPPVSGYQVAALAIGASGQGYIGVNLEFSGQAISQTVHAEQFAVALAKQHGETSLRHLVVTAAPCGHCRQFLLELMQPNLLMTIIGEDTWHTVSLSDLLPHPFVLSSHRHGMLTPSVFSLKRQVPAQARDSLVAMALDTASRAYVPYTRSWAGVALELESGEVLSAGTLESAAYNPTLPPMQAALVAVVASQSGYEQIKRAVLVELEGALVSWLESVPPLLTSLAPNAQFERVLAVPHEL